MPIIKSAKKRVRIANKASLRNSKTKRSLRTALKAFQKAAASKNSTAVTKAQREAQSELAKAGKKRILHKNKVARKQRQLARLSKTVAATKAPSTVKSTATKAKKAPVKAKKTVAKKTKS
jgi:small subunit ribosomal protein S20